VFKFLPLSIRVFSIVILPVLYFTAVYSMHLTNVVTKFYINHCPNFLIQIFSPWFSTYFHHITTCSVCGTDIYIYEKLRRKPAHPTALWVMQMLDCSQLLLILVYTCIRVQLRGYRKMWKTNMNICFAWFNSQFVMKKSFFYSLKNQNNYQKVAQHLLLLCLHIPLKILFAGYSELLTNYSRTTHELRVQKPPNICSVHYCCHILIRTGVPTKFSNNCHY
jgi:hypothetical protein